MRWIASRHVPRGRKDGVAVRNDAFLSLRGCKPWQSMGWHGVVCKVDCFTSFAKTARVIARSVVTRQSMVEHRAVCEVDCFAALAKTGWGS